jgi:hypothetical protein
MAYSCQVCGLVANDPDSLCNPKEVDRKFFKDAKVNRVGICEECESAAEYFCPACGRLAADADLLCDAAPIR